jgi:fatty acid desaturase
MKSLKPIEKSPKDFAWEDLKYIPNYQFIIEIFLPVPWLIISIILYQWSFWLLGLVSSFFFFLCCLRLNHEAIHNNLGLNRRWDHVIMHCLSALMIGSNHADAFCHLQHHKDTLGADDHEGHCATMPAWKVLLYGPRFPIDLNRETWRRGGKLWRRRLMIDWMLVVLFTAICVLSESQGLKIHVLIMLCGQCLTAFFAVWITHQGTVGTGLAGRSQRGPIAWIAYQMFFHREHHLFPKVPVSRLKDLARRLDSIVPGYAASRMPVTTFGDRVDNSTCGNKEHKQQLFP